MKRFTTNYAATSVSHTVTQSAPVIVGILRAGLPLAYGLHKIFPEAEMGFIAAKRNEETLQAQISYCALPDVRHKDVLLADTMLATGGSMIVCIKEIEKYAPRSIHTVSVLGSEQGVRRVQAYNCISARRVKNHVTPVKVHCAWIDPHLDSRGYIRPGLGDAGDRMYGKTI